jgi:hypothetical protein
MEYEIDDCDALFDPSTNPSLTHRHSEASRRMPRLYSWTSVKLRRKAVLIPEEGEEQPA